MAMQEVPCPQCIQTPGRSEQFIGTGRRGRPIYLPCNCPRCGGTGWIRMTKPGKRLRKKLDSIQADVRAARGR